MVNLLLLLFSSLSVAAPADSVAVFHRPEKVVILVNEQGSHGRIQRMMNAWRAERDLYWHTEDGALMINCGRNLEAASCTFRLQPGPNVAIGEKEAAGHALITEETVEDIHISFTSSRDNFFELTVDKGELSLHTKKR